MLDMFPNSPRRDWHHNYTKKSDWQAEIQCEQALPWIASVAQNRLQQALLKRIWQSRINIRCSSTHVHSKSPCPKWLLEGVKGFKTLLACPGCLILPVPNKQSDTFLQYQSSVFSSFFKVWCFISEEWISTRSCAFYHWQACVSLLYDTCLLLFGKTRNKLLLSNRRRKLFISHFRPDHEAVFLGRTAARPSQGRAFNCFLAGGSSWQCLTSFLPWIKKKKKKKKRERNLRNSGKKDFCLRLISPVEFVKQKKIL